MNCPLCNVVCIDRLRVYTHLCHPVKDGGHARKLDEAQALMPERTGQGTYGFAQ